MCHFCLVPLHHPEFGLGRIHPNILVVCSRFEGEKDCHKTYRFSKESCLIRGRRMANPCQSSLEALGGLTNLLDEVVKLIILPLGCSTFLVAKRPIKNLVGNQSSYRPKTSHVALHPLPQKWSSFTGTGALRCSTSKVSKPLGASRKRAFALDGKLCLIDGGN